MLKAVATVLCLMATPLMADMGQFPRVTAQDLNGRSVTLPKDLPSDPSIVIAAFKRTDQAAVDTWVEGMDLKGALDGRWIELPVIARGWRVMKPVIDNGMRSGITANKDRARAITLFRNRKEFVALFGEERFDRIYVLVVARDGTISHVESGTYSPQGAERILAAMGQTAD
ncbi:MAG: hypothetical protein AAF679_01920 [Pseudomonadota bacterium]